MTDYKQTRDAAGKVTSQFSEMLTRLGEEQEILEKAYDNDMDKWWNSLSKEEQMDAFYCVVKRIVKGELEDKGSYRYVLYEVFGFDASSYMLGMMCGYMALHNSINRDVEKFYE